jgi:uncharacterized protein (TIGR00725 family)
MNLEDFSSPIVGLLMFFASRLPIIAVIGSGTLDYAARSRAIGQWLASQPVHLLTGAGEGVMQAVTQAFVATPHRQGFAIGVVPCAEHSVAIPKAGYPNPWVEIPIYTHLPLSGQRGESTLSRNSIVILSATAVIALPGDWGTGSEVRLALKYQRPIIAYLKSAREIKGLPTGVRVESDFENVASFIIDHTSRNNHLE